MAPARLQIDCSGGRHTVLWKRGCLVLVDHDVAAETALQALGADRPACLALLERWRTTLLPVGPAGVARTPKVAPARASGNLRSPMAAGADLRSFGAELGRVIELAQLVRAERRWADPALPAADRSRLLGRFLGDLRDATAASLQSSSRARGRQQIAVQAHPLPSGEAGGVEVTTSAARIELELHLPLSWVVEVSGRGLTSVDGLIVLGVVDEDLDGALVGVIGLVWEVHGPGRVGAKMDRWWMTRTEGTWQTVASERPVRATRSLWCSTSQR
ncbi:MAG: hypothetical protein ACKV2O_11060 [Acidimicrobiales bacterium]